MNVNIFDDQVYEWVRFFQRPGYEWGRFRNTGSHTLTTITPELPPLPRPTHTHKGLESSSKVVKVWELVPKIADMAVYGKNGKQSLNKVFSENNWSSKHIIW